MTTLSLRKGTKLVARFGRAELMADALGRTEIRGGSNEDIAEAREWVSLFLHEATPRAVRKSAHTWPENSPA